MFPDLPPLVLKNMEGFGFLYQSWFGKMFFRDSSPFLMGALSFSCRVQIAVTILEE
jgi:hypothetical protein